MESTASAVMSKVPKVSKLRQPSSNIGTNAAKKPRLDAASSSSAAVKSAAAAAQKGPTGGKTSKPLFTVGSKSVPSRTASQRSAADKRSRSPPATSKKTTTKAGGKSKRAAWDTKGQLTDLREDFEQLRRELADKENQKQQLVVEKTQEISGAEAKHAQQLASLTAEKEAVERQSRDRERELQRQLDVARTELDDLSDHSKQQTAELKLLKKDIALLRLSEKEHLFDLKEKAATIITLTDKSKNLEQQLLASESSNKELVKERMIHEMERRRLHNTIQELKGNIRVFARVRPSLQLETAEKKTIFSFPDIDRKKLCLSRPSSFNESSIMGDNLKRAEKLDFNFDLVFEQDSSQKDVFSEISQLVQSALDGYNVCIFAYGQTGSGKTYTMQGPDDMSEDTEGIIPRSIAQIFESAKQLKDLGWEYSMAASFLEIYNETVHDLLGQPGSNVKHEIKSASGEMVVTNMSTVSVTQPQQVNSLFERATKNRRVAETNCNARSSRSHSVFALKISGENHITSETCVGTLNLVDLAGSERLKESKSQGDRLKETQSINSSLSALGNVILSLATKKPHIPYRDSKLTYLLQHSLGGNSKTLMFVNVSPQEEHFNETVNSLRFATKVNNCSIGTAKKTAK